ncbi:5463_t:CDS:2 [Cetraspora pellucida]|uniref:5463_t:CDS:1 n=1 Tax=Cetraspora pellucida TaxID=1433469 RepID=A0A9N8Z0C6_9GLOM|nr:5463_t:CDS:2 [Cetraspora pellucida]
MVLPKNIMSQIPKEDQCVCKRDAQADSSSDLKVVALIIGLLITTYWWLSW